jgi:RND family efflux transporter MFP subunit
MGIWKQGVVTLAVVAIAGAAWIRLDPSVGAALTSQDSLLPQALHPLVLAVAPEPTTRVGPTRGGRPMTEPLVVVDAARPSVTRDRLRAVGTGEAERSVPVYPDAAGIVTEVDVRPGTLVSAGDVLARLESADQELAVERARIALLAAEEQLQRYRSLSSSAAVTAVQLQETERALQTARLDLRAAEIALERRSVLAPIGGRVGLTSIDTGALVGNTTLIATIDDRARLKVAFNAPEGFVSELAIGQPVSALPTTRTGTVYEGEISAIDSRIDEASRTLRVEALLDNEADDLRPGMSFSIELALPGQEFLSVDPLAVQWERAGPYVWVVRDGAAEKAGVRIVERNVDRLLVASDDLQDGEAVVVEGIQSLREGVAVRVREPEGATDTGTQGPPIADAPEAAPATEGGASRRAAFGTGANAAEIAR